MRPRAAPRGEPIAVSLYNSSTFYLQCQGEIPKTSNKLRANNRPPQGSTRATGAQAQRINPPPTGPPDRPTTNHQPPPTGSPTGSTRAPPDPPTATPPAARPPTTQPAVYPPDVPNMYVSSIHPALIRSTWTWGATGDGRHGTPRRPTRRHAPRPLIPPRSLPGEGDRKTRATPLERLGEFYWKYAWNPYDPGGWEDGTRRKTAPLLVLSSTLPKIVVLGRVGNYGKPDRKWKGGGRSQQRFAGVR